jgi:hypothetical protein
LHVYDQGKQEKESEIFKRFQFSPADSLKIRYHCRLRFRIKGLI